MKFDGIKNLRDLGGIPCEGGKPLRSGIIFRSDFLTKASQEDCRKISEQLHVDEIIDLRTCLELKEKPDAVVAGAEYIHIPIFEESVIGITHETGSDYGTFIRHSHDREAIRAFIPDMNQVYGYVMTDDAIIEKMAQAIRRVVDNVLAGKVSLFHCSEGKDRAGALAALLLSLLGADEKDIFADYEATNRVVKKKARLNTVLVFLLKRDALAAKKIWRASIADPAYIKLSFDVIKNRFGSMDNFFVQAAGISDELRSQFRSKALSI